MPELIIIAGPNGAGKSTTSDDLLFDLGINSFDWDKEFYPSWAKFGYDPAVENGVTEAVNKLFEERKQEAIASRSSFSFETNYHSDEILETITEFRKAGFSIELIFIALESPEVAIDRVKDRVSKGGHDVSEETIRKRFHDGLLLLDSTFALFDVVSIYVSRSNSISSCILLSPQKGIKNLFHPIPDSILGFLPNLKALLS